MIFASYSYNSNTKILSVNITEEMVSDPTLMVSNESFVIKFKFIMKHPVACISNAAFHQQKGGSISIHRFLSKAYKHYYKLW